MERHKSLKRQVRGGVGSPTSAPGQGRAFLSAVWAVHSYTFPCAAAARHRLGTGRHRRRTRTRRSQAESWKRQDRGGGGSGCHGLCSGLPLALRMSASPCYTFDVILLCQARKPLLLFGETLKAGSGWGHHRGCLSCSGLGAEHDHVPTAILHFGFSVQPGGRPCPETMATSAGLHLSGAAGCRAGRHAMAREVFAACQCHL